MRHIYSDEVTIYQANEGMDTNAFQRSKNVHINLHNTWNVEKQQWVCILFKWMFANNVTTV